MIPKRLLCSLGWLAAGLWLVSACLPAQAPSQATGEAQSLVPPGEGREEEDHEHASPTVALEAVALGSGEKLQVMATTNIVADIVFQVGAGYIDLTPLLPPGADPHTYTLTPQDRVAAASAHVIFANGANLEAEILPRLTQDIQAPIVYVSQGIQLRQLEAGEANQHEGEGTDPHTWTTPTNAIVFLHNVEAALSALDPDNTENYQANMRRYEAELVALDEWVKEQIGTVPVESRKLVTDHETFGYYADRYGLDQIGAVIPSFSTAAEPSAQKLAALQDAIRQYQVRAVFVGTTVTPSLVNQIAEDTGTKLVTLYTGSLGPPGSGVETYIDYVRYNTAAIVEGLR